MNREEFDAFLELLPDGSEPDVYKGFPECPYCGTDTSKEMGAELRGERDALRDLLSACIEWRSAVDAFSGSLSPEDRALFEAIDKATESDHTREEH